MNLPKVFHITVQYDNWDILLHADGADFRRWLKIKGNTRCF